MTVQPMWQRVGIAALQGALLWWLYAALDAARWPATGSGPYVALVTNIVLVPPRLQKKGEFRVVESEWSVLMLGDRAFRYREREPRLGPSGGPRTSPPAPERASGGALEPST